MIRLGFFKSAGKVTKVLICFLLSAAIFNMGLMTSHRCSMQAGVQDVHVIQFEQKFPRNENSSHVLVELPHGKDRSTGSRDSIRQERVPLWAATGVHRGLKKDTVEQHRLDQNMRELPSVLRIAHGAVIEQPKVGQAFVARQGRLRDSPRRDFDTKHQAHNDINATWVKEMISTLPKTRHLAPWGKHEFVCQNQTYSGDMRVSVIVTFHENEKVSRILHTVHSILQRTPPELLQEVILIDDHSKKEDLKEILQIYVRSVFGPKVSLKTNWLKKGLIGARLAGTRLAKGDIIVCMDSHMEVQHKWLEPLLKAIQTNRKTLAASYLDWMEFDSQDGVWTYRHGASTWKTYFDWTFTFGFQDIPVRMKNSRDPSEPVPSPCTIGTIFAIDKQFFREIGEFDDDMLGWGGENLDLPLRVWMFGGRVVNVPCSHVAHIEEAGQRNYRLGWDHAIVRNYRRVADVWLGEDRHHVYRYKPSMQLRNIGINVCLSATPPHPPIIMECLSNRPAKTEFSWSETGELRFPLHAFSAVRAYSESALQTDEWIPHFNTSMLSKWIHWKGGPLLDFGSRRCLSTVKGTYRLLMTKCNFTSPYQQWTFTNYAESYTTLTTSQAPVPPKNDNHMLGAYLRTLRNVMKWLQSNDLEQLYGITYQTTRT